MTAPYHDRDGVRIFCGDDNATILRTVAILCAARKSVYKSMPDLEVYDIDRDVRTFAGHMPIVAHPPCRAWSAFCAHQAKPIAGEKELAPLCVEWLRKCGGVLEHPAHSRLWAALDLPTPTMGITPGLFSIAVKQSWFGDGRSKCTWLLFAGIDPNCIDVPFRLHSTYGDRRRWQVMSKHQRAASTPEFAQWLVALARKSTILRDESKQ